jgi:hypothetical protein
MAKKKTSRRVRRKTVPTVGARAAGPEQIEQEVRAFFTTTHERLLAAKKRAEADLRRRTGAEGVVLAARERKPLGGALDAVVNEYGGHLAPEYTFVDPSGALLNRAQMLDGLRAGAGIFEDFTRTQTNVRVYGNRAVVTSLIKVRGESAGQEVTGQYYETHTLLRNGGLVLLATQLTRIQEINALVEKLVDACD